MNSLVNTQSTTDSIDNPTRRAISTVFAARDRRMLVGDLVTTKEAAELLRVSHWTVSAWLSQGKLRRIKAGGRTLIAKSDLEAFLRLGNSRQ